MSGKNKPHPPSQYLKDFITLASTVETATCGSPMTPGLQILFTLQQFKHRKRCEHCSPHGWRTEAPCQRRFEADPSFFVCVSVCAFMSDINGQRQSKGLWEGWGNESEVDL